MEEQVQYPLAGYTRRPRWKESEYGGVKGLIDPQHAVFVGPAAGLQEFFASERARMEVQELDRIVEPGWQALHQRIELARQEASRVHFPMAEALGLIGPPRLIQIYKQTYWTVHAYYEVGDNGIVVAPCLGGPDHYASCVNKPHSKRWPRPLPRSLYWLGRLRDKTTP